MPQTDADRIEQLQDEVEALKQFLLAHVLAVDSLERTVTLDTLESARLQSDGALAARRGRVAISIDHLVKAIEESLD